MINKLIQNINLSDFEALIKNSVSEGKSIEYKQVLSFKPGSERKEFLYDVSSFANASGGDLIFGISENRDSGLPEKIEGIEIINPDKLILEIESSIRDSISPRIAGIQIACFKIEELNYILLIRVPKSWNSPHLVTYDKSYRFYTRATNGKHLMDVSELRSAFLLSGTIADRIRTFKTDRISKIYSNDSFIPLIDGAKIVLHLIPASSFDASKEYDFNYVLSDHRRLELIGGGGRDLRYNLEGLLTYSSADINSNVAYTQLFRNGIIEAVDCGILKTNMPNAIPSVRGWNYEVEILKAIKGFRELIEAVKIELPVFVFLSFTGVNGFHMEYGNVYARNRKIDREILQIPEIVIQSQEIYSESLMKPVFDMVWNACGLPRSQNYSEAGNWSPNA